MVAFFWDFLKIWLLCGMFSVFGTILGGFRSISPLGIGAFPRQHPLHNINILQISGEGVEDFVFFFVQLGIVKFEQI